MNELVSTNELISVNLHRLVFAMDRAANHILLREFGLTYNRAYFLFMLQMRGPLSQRELGAALGYRASSVSTMVAELVKTGYVTVAPSPNHGRKRVVSLTLLGETSVEAGRALLDKHFQSIMRTRDINEQAYAKQTKALYDGVSAYIKQENL